MKKALFYTFAAGMAVMSSLTASAQNEGGGAAVEKCKSVTKTPEANAPAKTPLFYDYDVLKTFYTNSGAQPAIVSNEEGNYIYTGSPNPDETGDKHVFHKYDRYASWSAEGFDIEGVPGVISLTSDGTFFYGIWHDEIYKMDFDKKKLLKKFTGSDKFRYCAYDPDANEWGGFWLGTDSRLYFMYYDGQFKEGYVRVPAADGCVYVGHQGRHLLLSCRGVGEKSEIYDYDIDENIVTGPLFDVAEIAGIEGVSGGIRDLTVCNEGRSKILFVNLDRGSLPNAVVPVLLNDIQWPSSVVSDEVVSLPFYEGFENSSPTIRYWYGIDADGDGYNWFLNFCYDWYFYSGSFDPESGYGMAASQSCRNDVKGFAPDNWLVSPIIEEGSDRKLRFGVKSTRDGYDDKLAVYVIDGSEDVDKFIESPRNKLMESIIDWSYWRDFNLDLDGYRGPIRIAFRHFDSIDQFAIAIDNLEVTGTTTTGIEEVDAGGREADSRMYDVAGRRISNPAKGQLYIKGGKKYIAR